MIDYQTKPTGGGHDTGRGKPGHPSPERKVPMDKLQALMNTLDAQLTILNIEGIRSEHVIEKWTEEESEYEMAECPECHGSGEIYSDHLEWFNDEFEEWETYSDFITCPECDGCGKVEVEHTKMVEYVESWTESNIVI